MKKAALHMKIENGLKEKLRNFANIDNRTLSNLVEKVLQDYVKQRGARREMDD